MQKSEINLRAFVPNALTLCNLLCGCMGLLCLFSDNYAMAGWFVFIAALFDVFDGLVARILGVSGELGRELDSLSDVVSFGVLPAFIAFKMMLVQPLVWKGLAFVVFVLALASAYRLAKFNIDTTQKKDFLGMPTPASAIFWASLCLHWAKTSFVLNPYVILILSLIFAFLMVCNWKMFSLKATDWSWQARKVVYIYAVLCFALIVVFRFLGVSIAILFYPVFSRVHYTLETVNGKWGNYFNNNVNK